MDLKRRKKEQAVAAEIANEITRQLGPVAPEMLASKSEVICKIFADAFDSHGVVSEASGARILGHVPIELADRHRKLAEFHRQLDAAIRPMPNANRGQR